VTEYPTMITDNVLNIKNKNEKKCLCFVHIPKTGGITLINALSSLFSGHELTGHTHFLPKSTADYKFIYGHNNFSEFESIAGPKCYVTCLREPVSRIVSNYRFWLSMKDQVHNNAALLSQVSAMSFADFVKTLDPEILEGATDNVAVRQLSNAGDLVTEDDFKLACKNLEKMDFIFFQESLDADIACFFRTLDLQSPDLSVRHNSTDGNAEVAPMSTAPLARSFFQMTKSSESPWKRARTSTRNFMNSLKRSSESAVAQENRSLISRQNA
jgi:hypothetical protein